MHRISESEIRTGRPLGIPCHSRNHWSVVVVLFIRVHIFLLQMLDTSSSGPNGGTSALTDPDSGGMSVCVPTRHV